MSIFAFCLGMSKDFFRWASVIVPVIQMEKEKQKESLGTEQSHTLNLWQGLAENFDPQKLNTIFNAK